MNVNEISRKIAETAVLSRKRGNPGTRRKIRYKNVVCAFDIETTRIPQIEQSVMYLWQFSFGLDCQVHGRTWEECEELFKLLVDSCEEDVYYVIYVHNLSYEFQFLRGIYHFTNDEVFAVKSRKVLKCEMYGHLEFRCSYLQTHLSLDNFLKQMNVENKKIAGYDYDKLRWPWTPLTDFELSYGMNDVIGLVQAIEKRMTLYGDDLYSIPLTSTGYVRREAKKAMRRIPHTVIPSIFPSIDQYIMFREAFRGGNTHANRYYSGMKLLNIRSADRSSSYPDVMVNCKFPVSRFKPVPDCSYDNIYHQIFERGKAMIMRVALSNVSLIDPMWGCPYLSKDKSRKIENGVYDNGRILSADYMETTITDIDLRIIIEEYQCDVQIIEAQQARYGKLPQPLIDLIIKLYKDKTELKGVEGEEAFYLLSKEMINACYGMMAQDPVKQSIDYENDWSEMNDDPAELLDKARKKAFLVYQWGVWVTAWARYRLEEGIRNVGWRFIYADTDSVKYLDVDGVSWEDYNNERISASTEAGAYAKDPKGITHYMGVFEDEGIYSEFATLGAKKYVYREGDGPLHVTISGVNKKKGGPELEAHGGIGAFCKRDMIFREAGGTEIKYNDDPEVKTWETEGHSIRITPNACIRPSTYSLSITAEYEEIINHAHKMLTNIKYYDKIKEKVKEDNK